MLRYLTIGLAAMVVSLSVACSSTNVTGVDLPTRNTASGALPPTQGTDTMGGALPPSSGNDVMSTSKGTSSGALPPTQGTDTMGGALPPSSGNDVMSN